MLECDCCGKQISKDDKFYIIDDEYCCDECVVEEHRTVYIVCGEDYYEEDDIIRYEDINDYINYLEKQIQIYNNFIKTNNELIKETKNEEHKKDLINKINKYENYISENNAELNRIKECCKE